MGCNISSQNAQALALKEAAPARDPPASLATPLVGNESREKVVSVSAVTTVLDANKPKRPSPQSSYNNRSRVLSRSGSIVGSEIIADVVTDYGPGISLRFLKEFYAALQTDGQLKQQLGLTSLSSVTTKQLIDFVIVPKTKEHGCGFVHVPGLVPSSDLGPADYFICHAHCNSFSHLVETLCNHLRGYPDTDVRLWIDVFVYPQYEAYIEESLDDIPDVVRCCPRGTLIVVDATAAVLHCSWCLFMLMSALEFRDVDDLVLVSPELSPDQLAQLILTVDVSQAACVDQKSHVAIIQQVTRKNGGVEQFNNKLKLLLKLRPFNYQVDMQSLRPQTANAGSNFNFKPLVEAVNNQLSAEDVHTPPLVYIQGSLGTGTSTISAALCSGNFRCEGVPLEAHACHFFNQDDARRQDLTRIVRTFGFQLACSIPSLEHYYVSALAHALPEVGNDVDKLFDLLLTSPLTVGLSCDDVHVVILLDALDEAYVTPGNHSLLSNVGFLLVRLFTNLPPHVHLVLTSRTSEPVELLPILREWYQGLTLLEPNNFRGMSHLKNLVITELQLNYGISSEDADHWLASTSVSPTQGSASMADSALFLTLLSQLLIKPKLRPTSFEELPASLYGVYAAMMRPAVNSQTSSKVMGSSNVKSRPRKGSKCGNHSSMALIQEDATPSDQPSQGLQVADNVQNIVDSVQRVANSVQAKDGSSSSTDPIASLRDGNEASCSTHHDEPQRQISTKHKHTWPGHIYSLVCVVLAAFEPIPVPLLHDLLVDDTLASLLATGLFYQHNSLLHCLHKSVKEWLAFCDANHQYFVDMEAGHLRLSQHFVARVKQGIFDLYALKYLAIHLESAGDNALTEEFLKDYYFLPFAVKILRLGVAASTIHAFTRSNSPIARKVARWLRFVFIECSPNALNSKPIFQLALHSIPEITSPIIQILGAKPQLDSVLIGHSNNVRDVTFSPDGTTIATASADKTVKVWNAMTLHCVATLVGHTDEVYGVAFSPDSSMLASCSCDNTIRVWDASTTHCVAVLSGHNGWVRSVAFSPDGKSLGSASSDGTAKLWDTTTFFCSNTFWEHKGWVRTIAFSPDGKFIATGSSDNTAMLWDASTMTNAATLEGHTAAVACVTFSPDSKYLATCSNDKSARLWDLSTFGCAKTFIGHNGWVRKVAFSPNGDMMATASLDTTAKIWNTTTRKCLGTFTSHWSEVHSVEFSPDGLTLATSSMDQTVILNDVDSVLSQPKKSIVEHSGAVQTVAFGRNGQVLVSGSSDTSIRVWDAESRACTLTLTGHGGIVVNVACSPDGSSIASASFDGSIKVWDAHTGMVKATLLGHVECVNCVSWSPDCNMLVSCCSNNVVMLWDAGGARCVATLSGHDDSVQSVAFSPDARMLASAGHDRVIKIWHVTTRKCTATMSGHTGAVLSLSYHPSGSVLASACSDQTVKLWDLTGFTCTATLIGHTAAVHCVVFSVDGDWIATSSDDKTAKIWSATSLQCLATLVGHTGAVLAVALSPDRKVVATGSEDKTAILWDATQCVRA